MINFSTFLTESRLDFLKKNHTSISSDHDSLATHRSASDIINHFATHADPSANKSNTQWIINRYKDRDFRQEDHGRIRSTLENFQKHKAKLPQKDINHYKSLSDLEDAVEPHLGTLSKKQEKAQVKHEGADLLHDGPEFMVHKLKTKEAACHYGKGTKWCTAADKDNKFNRYHREGPLFVVTHKQTQEKHQFHFESNQFMDAKDRSIDLHGFVSKNPELKEVKEFRDKSPHFGRNEKEVHEIIGNMLKGRKYSMKKTALEHPSVTSDHIDKALGDSSQYLRKAAIEHPKATEKHIDKALSDENEYVRMSAIEHPNATVEHIDKAMSDSDVSVRATAIEHPKATSDHIDKAITDESVYVKRAAIIHPNATEKHIDKALGDTNGSVREAAVKHPKATEKHIDKAMTDSDWSVRAWAIIHPNATEKHIDKALSDSDWSVRKAAISHPKATSDHIDKAMSDSDVSIRKAAIEHTNATSDHIDKALDDAEWSVRAAANKRKQKDRQNEK